MRRAPIPVIALCLAIILCLTGALIVVSRENHQRQRVITRVNQFMEAQGSFADAWAWTSAPGEERIDDKRTQVRLLHSGKRFNDFSNLCTIVKIYNPAYTAKSAQFDYDFHFSMSRLLSRMEMLGYKAIIFTNGKQTWNYPVKIRKEPLVSRGVS